MSGGERTAADRDSSRGRPQDGRVPGRQREIATDGGTGHHSPEDDSERSSEQPRDRVGETGPSGAGPDRSADAARPESPTAEDRTAGSTGPSEPDAERPLAERSRERIEREIEQLEQSLEQYETRDQAVIDRYEGLLAERRYRQRQVETERERSYRQRLRRVTDRALRAVGLR